MFVLRQSWRRIRIFSRGFSSDEFKGLEGQSACVERIITGPEPVYQKLNENMYKTFKQSSKVHLKHGGVLPEAQIAYETWGSLNREKDNAILLFTGLSANSHAKQNEGNSSPGWWEDFIGDELAIDTEKFFIICCNHLGSCFGST